MTKISYLMAVALFSLMALTSCKPSIIMSHNGGKKLDPSSKVVTRNYDNLKFQSIETDIVGDVEFIQTSDNKCHVSITGPDNYFPLFIVKSEEGTLNVSTDDKYNLDDVKVKVRIYAPTAKSIENDGVGNVTVAKLNTDNLAISNSGVGSFKISNLETGSISVDNSGVGSVSIQGKASKATYDNSGVGSIDAVHFHVVSVKADVSGVGSVKCYASESINGSVSGVGSLKYAGNPKKKDISCDGIGGAKSINE